MNGFLVPANAKKGLLYFNMFRTFDLILFGTGLGISLLLLLLFQGTDVWIMILFMLPGLITGFLVIPIPNYHNVLCAIQSMIRFYNSRRRFVWRGWCFYEQFIEEAKRSK